ncbi:MAG: proteasome accessory factor C [Candidatus Endobugula sp.]|jgi:proteasome accessory factor C
MEKETHIMDKFDKIQQLHRLLINHRFPIPIRSIAEELECTKATAKKAIDTLRDYLHAPLYYDEHSKGWQYDKHADTFELPGLWLTSKELHGLATILHTLDTIGEGLLGNEIAVVQQQVEKLLKAKGIKVDSFIGSIKYLSMNKRPIISQFFSTVVDALVHQKQLFIRYNDYLGRVSQRTISPQYLIHYQENWYLDAWCHKRKGLRSFMLSRITYVMKQDDNACIISVEECQQHYQTSYGIFAGKPKHLAILQFYPPVTNEVASIQWHPDQQTEWQGDNYLITIPYNDDRELVRDILKYGNHVEVIQPAALKHKIKNIAQSVAGLYRE